MVLMDVIFLMFFYTYTYSLIILFANMIGWLSNDLSGLHKYYMYVSLQDINERNGDRALKVGGKSPSTTK